MKKKSRATSNKIAYSKKKKKKKKFRIIIED